MSNLQVTNQNWPEGHSAVLKNQMNPVQSAHSDREQLIPLIHQPKKVRAVEEEEGGEWEEEEGGSWKTLSHIFSRDLTLSSTHVVGFPEPIWRSALGSSWSAQGPVRGEESFPFLVKLMVKYFMFFSCLIFKRMS